MASSALPRPEPLPSAEDIRQDIALYCSQRPEILKNAQLLVQEQAEDNEAKRKTLVHLRRKLALSTEKTIEFRAKAEKLEDVSLRVSQLRRELMDLFNAISQAKQFVSRKSFQDPKIQRLLLISSSDESPKRQTHDGITFEDDQRQLQKRLHVVQINAGTPEKLIEWIAVSKTEDKMRYMTDFCLTYRYYMESGPLLEQLMALYASLGERDNDKSCRMNVINFMQHWIKYHYQHDFEDNPELEERTQAFISSQITALEGDKVASILLDGMQKRRSQNQLRKSQLAAGKVLSQSQDTNKKTFTEKPPEVVAPKGDIQSHLDISPLELARQLCLMDHELFCAIQPKECLNCNWSGKKQEEKAPNILAMIARFNRNSNCVITSIVTRENLKARSQMLLYWMQVVTELYHLNNFNGMIVIIASLSSSSIFRLKKTWERIPAERLQEYRQHCTVIATDNASKKYRAHVHACNPPLVPNLGLYLQDLTFIEDGNQLFLANGWVNFVKCRMISAQIQEMILYQKTSYNLTAHPAIQSFIRNAPTMPENDHFEASLQCEARRVAPKKA